MLSRHWRYRAVQTSACGGARTHLAWAVRSPSLARPRRPARLSVHLLVAAEGWRVGPGAFETTDLAWSSQRRARGTATRLRATRRAELTPLAMRAMAQERPPDGSEQREAAIASENGTTCSNDKREACSNDKREATTAARRNDSNDRGTAAPEAPTQKGWRQTTGRTDNETTNNSRPRAER